MKPKIKLKIIKEYLGYTYTIEEVQIEYDLESFFTFIRLSTQRHFRSV